MTPADCCTALRGRGVKITPDAIRLGIEQGQFPWGLHIRTAKGNQYLISPAKFETWADEWFPPGKED